MIATRIFYIDDDKDDLLLVEEILAEIDQLSCIFESVDDLMELLNNPPPSPSIIFLDLNMPMTDGLEILETLRSNPQFDKIPIIMISTGASPLKIQKSRELGANLFMIKASSIDGLKKSFRHVLEIDWQIYRATDNDFLYTG